MALAKYPQFGAQAGFIRTSTTNRSDQAELQAGRHTEVLVRSTTKECAATKSDCSWGVEPSGTGENLIILDSIRLNVEDEPQTNFTAAQIGEVDPDLPLLVVKCCLVRRARISLAITGKGDVGYELGATTRPATLQTAIGSLDLVPIITTLESSGAVLRITSYTVNDTAEDWQSFNVEYTAYIDANEDGDSVAQPLLTSAGVEPPACDCSTDNCCDSFKIEWSLNGTGYAEISGTVTKNPMIASPYTP